jgi:hypothetical protein
MIGWNQRYLLVRIGEPAKAVNFSLLIALIALRFYLGLSVTRRQTGQYADTRIFSPSITHIFRAQQEADFDIRKTGHATPNDGVSWWRITSAVQVTAESRELHQAGL